MPSELLTDDSGAEYRAYLTEVHSIGGLSGSPVFVYLAPARSVGKDMHWERTFILLGLVRGHWDYKPSLNELEFGNAELQAVNMGIAIVTPIQEVMEIINGEEWTKERRKYDEDTRKKREKDF